MNIKRVLFLGLIVIVIACNLSGSKGEENIEACPYGIVYNVAMNEEHSDYDIWSFDNSTGISSNITNNPDVAWTYTAVDDKVLFISDRDTCYRCFYLYEMSSFGSEIRQVTEFRLRDSWMSSRKNGSELIVNPHTDVDSSFYIIDRNGKVLSKINTGLTYASDPAFSPDGNDIVFRGSEKKSKKEPEFNEALYKMSLSDGNVVKLTHYPKTDTTAPWYAYKAGPPKWHPNDDLISYQSLQNGKYSLYGVSPDGSKQWKLTDNPQEEGWHDWSPDGKWLAIEIFNSDQTQFHIGLMNWETKKMKILTDSTHQYQQCPVFLSHSKSPTIQ